MVLVDEGSAGHFGALIGAGKAAQLQEQHGDRQQDCMSRGSVMAGVAKVQNLLASRVNPHELIEADLAQVIRRHGLRQNKRLRCGLLRLYESYLAACIADRELTGAEVSALQHLRAVFSLSERDALLAYERTAERVCRESLDEVPEDRGLSEEGLHVVASIRTGIGLPRENAERIMRSVGQKLLARRVEEALQDERIDDGEIRELERLARGFGLPLANNERTRQLLERYRLYWLIEEGDIPSVEVGIRLQRGESCYFKAAVAWYEYRSVTKSINYGGITSRVRIAKGIYLSAGSVGAQRLTEDILKLIDLGSLYLTNKRLIFVGNRANKSIRLTQVLNFEPMANGVRIEKEHGKTPFLVFDDDIDIFSLCLDRSLRDL